MSPGIKSALDIAEQIVEDNFRIGNTLTFDERWWLKAADLLELFLWSHEQIFMGNRNAKNILDNIGDYVCLREAKIFPQALLEVYRNWTAKRLKELPDSMFQKPK